MKYNKELEQRKKEIIAKAGCCEKCGRKNNLTIDHIIPLLLLKQFGFSDEQTFDEMNFQVLCGICNTFKSNQLDFVDPRTKAILLRYLDRI